MKYFKYCFFIFTMVIVNTFSFAQDQDKTLVKLNDPIDLNKEEIKKGVSLPASLEESSSILSLKTRQMEKDKEVFDRLRTYLKNYNFIDYKKDLTNLKNYGLRDKEGNTLLHLAVISRNSPIFQETLKYIDPNIKNNRGNTALHFIAQIGDMSMLTSIMRKGADINAENDEKETPLLQSVYYGRRYFIQQLRGYPVDLNKGSVQGLTPIHIAAYRGLDSILIELISMGANVNITDIDGITPLHYAAGNGHKNSVNILLNHKASINAEDKAHNTPIYNAVVEGHIYVFNILRYKGAKLDVLDKVKRNLLQSAIVFKRYKMAMELAPIFKKDIDHQDENGNTALHLAIMSGYKPVISLLEQYSPVNIQNQQGQNALLIGIQKKLDQSVLSNIVKHKEFDVNQKDVNGETILHYTARYKASIPSELLTDDFYKIDAFVKNIKGETPLDIASVEGNSSIFNYYLSKYPKDVFSDTKYVNNIISQLEDNKFYYLARKVKKNAWEYKKISTKENKKISTKENKKIKMKQSIKIKKKSKKKNSSK